MTGPRVSIGCFHGEFDGFSKYPVSVAVDVIRATTTAVTGVAQGRRCFPVASIDEAVELAAGFDDPLLVGELGGSTPYGFSLTNSPADVARRADVDRPMILLSTSGTRLIAAAPRKIFVACLRNYSALTRHLVSISADVALIGAGTRGEFREEDALCCARIAAGLLDSGFHAGDEQTARIIERWTDQPVDAFVGGKSTEYLRASGQLRDLEFILTHIDDLDGVFAKVGREIALDANDHVA